MWLSDRGVCGTQTINISTVCSPSRTPTPPEPQEYSEVDKNIFKSPTVAKYANIWMIALLLGQLHTHVAHKQLQTSRGVSWRGTNMHTCSDYIKSIPVNSLYTHPASQTMWCKYTDTHTLQSREWSHHIAPLNELQPLMDVRIPVQRATLTCSQQGVS